MHRRRFLGGLGILAAGAAVPWIGCNSRASAAPGPREILIIRHAEEPDKGESIHLNDRGRRRAEALVTLFPSRFQPPQFLFAARPTVHTNRSVETLQPLAAALRLTIDQRFDDVQYAKLSRTLAEATYAGSGVLICWQHSAIPDLARALGAPAPPKWPDQQYDRVWQIRYEAGGPTLSDLPQGLLPKDSR
jgi:hypothetical protein